jgi:single-strand DNA-binding protein
MLVGRLTRDPELRYTQQGTAVANFTIAINRPFKNEQGEQQADFINGVVWRKPAENLAKYMKKGNQIGVDGRLQSRTYEQDGRTVYVTEVIADSIQFLESKGSNKDENNQQQHNNQQNNSQQQNNQNQSNPFVNDGEPIDISDDDLPF